MQKNKVKEGAHDLWWKVPLVDLSEKALLWKLNFSTLCWKSYVKCGDKCSGWGNSKCEGPELGTSLMVVPALNCLQVAPILVRDR